MFNWQEPRASAADSRRTSQDIDNKMCREMAQFVLLFHVLVTTLLSGMLCLGLTERNGERTSEEL